MTSLGDLPATLFSPTKMVFISYVAMTILKILPAPSLCTFLLLSATFWVVEVGHNDFLRIWLNNKAGK